MGVDEFAQLSTTIGVTAATILYIAFNMIKGRQERARDPVEKPNYAKAQDIEAVVDALASFRAEFTLFTKEMRDAMIAHGERIAKAETRLEERKR